MRKKIFLILTFFILFFSFIDNVYAVDCGNIQKMIRDYEYHDEKQKEACKDTSTEENTVTCNNSKLEKNLIVADFMKYSEENEICQAAKSRVDEIIDANKDNCSRVLDDDFESFVNKVMVLFYILGPLFLIVFGSLDYAKATAEGTEEGLKKANKNFAKRVVATVLLFLAPVITNIIIDLNVSDYYLSGNAYSCNYSFTVFNDVRKIGMVQIQRDKKIKSSSVIGGNHVGNYVLFAQSDSAWSSERLLAGSTTIGLEGCALTSVAMAIVNSGVETVEPINPSSLNKILRNNGSYGCDDGSCIVWSGTAAATNDHLVLESNTSVSGNISNKTVQIADYLNKGYHIVLQVKDCQSDGSHYVYVLHVENGNIIVGDASNGQILNLNESDYPIALGTCSSQTLLYKVVD